VEIGLHREQDFRVSLLESIVSIHDAGKWMADLDVSLLLDTPKSVTYLDEWQCTAKSGHQSFIIFLETWDEIFDLP
jgi:hypothetical protein